MQLCVTTLVLFMAIICFTKVCVMPVYATTSIGYANFFSIGSAFNFPNIQIHLHVCQI